MQKVWNLIRLGAKEAESLKSLKEKITWGTDKCVCRLCKSYIDQDRFVWKSAHNFRVLSVFIRLFSITFTFFFGVN